MLLRTEEVYQYIAIMVRVVFNYGTDSGANLHGQAIRERRLRRRREEIISPVEQREVQQGTLQVGGPLRRR